MRMKPAIESMKISIFANTGRKRKTHIPLSTAWCSGYIHRNFPTHEFVKGAWRKIEIPQKNIPVRNPNPNPYKGMSRRHRLAIRHELRVKAFISTIPQIPALICDAIP